MPTVYAAFLSHDAVNAAVGQLQLFGFSKASIRLEADAVFRTPPHILDREDGFLSGVENMFARLRKNTEPFPSDFYQDTIRRGGIVLALDVATLIEEQTARALLRNAGAIDAAAHDGRSKLLPLDEALPGAEDSFDVEASDRTVSVGGLPLYKIFETAAPSSRSTASEADLRAFLPGIYEVRQQVETIRLTKMPRVIAELSVNKSITVHTETIHETVRGTAIDLEQSVAQTPATENAISAKCAAPRGV